MVKVRFTGRSDARVLAASDLAKAGVEGFTKTVFARNAEVEVEDEVAEALTSKSALFGKFERVEREAPAQVPNKVETTDIKPAKTADKK